MDNDYKQVLAKNATYFWGDVHSRGIDGTLLLDWAVVRLSQTNQKEGYEIQRNAVDGIDSA